MNATMSGTSASRAAFASMAPRPPSPWNSAVKNGVSPRFASLIPRRAPRDHGGERLQDQPELKRSAEHPRAGQVAHDRVKETWMSHQRLLSARP